MAVTRWTFSDPITSATWTFTFNPNASGLPGVKRNIQYQNTAGPNGQVLVFLGRDQVQQFKFSGAIRDEDHYNNLYGWSLKRYPITITDDLGNSFYAVIDDFNANRKRSATAPWRIDYDMTISVLFWL